MSIMKTTTTWATVLSLLSANVSWAGNAETIPESLARLRAEQLWLESGTNPRVSDQEILSGQLNQLTYNPADGRSFHYHYKLDPQNQTVTIEARTGYVSNSPDQYKVTAKRILKIEPSLTPGQNAVKMRELVDSMNDEINGVTANKSTPVSNNDPYQYPVDTNLNVALTFAFLTENSYYNNSAWARGCNALGYRQATKADKDIFKATAAYNGIRENVICRNYTKYEIVKKITPRKLQEAGRIARQFLEIIAYPVTYPMAILMVLVFGIPAWPSDYHPTYEFVDSIKYFIEDIKKELGPNGYEKVNLQIENHEPPESLEWMKDKGPNSKKIYETYKANY